MRLAVPEFLRARFARHGELNELGWSPMFVITTDGALALIALICTLQRPASDYLVAVPVGIMVAMCPLVVFFAAGASFNPLLIWGAWSGAAAIFLFGTSTPIAFDFAPLILVLMVGAVGAMTPLAGGLAATASAVAMLGAAAASDRLDGVWLYLSVLGMGWLVGYLMRIQQQLIVAQRAAQDALSAHAAADERRRIAREVHDVIAHSLSVTLLHLTGARRALQEDRDVDDAVDALEDAEKLGREAMADIRRTVGLLDVAPMVEIDQAPDNCFRHAQPLREFRVGHTRRLHGGVKRKLGCLQGRNGDGIRSRSGLRKRPAELDVSAQRRHQRVNRLFAGFLQGFAFRHGLGNLRKGDDVAAVLRREVGVVDEAHGILLL